MLFRQQVSFFKLSGDVNSGVKGIFEGLLIGTPVAPPTHTHTHTLDTLRHQHTRTRLEPHTNTHIHTHTHVKYVLRHETRRLLFPVEHARSRAKYPQQTRLAHRAQRSS